MSFTVYKSSAGSGKTFTLVKEYLTIVLKDPKKYSAVLAITFTNKAAGEMKDRVLKTLKVLSHHDPLAPDNNDTIKYLLPDLLVATNLDETQLVNRATIVLELILHNYTGFAIGTIDSFVHRIVKTFAHDLHLPLNFSVEMDGKALISQAVDILIDKMGDDKLLTEVLLAFAKTKADDDKSWRVDIDLKSFAAILLQEDSQIHIDKLKNLTLSDFKGILIKTNTLVRAFENKLKLISKDTNDIIRASNIPTSSFSNGDKGIAKYFQYIELGRFDKLTPNTFVYKTINEDKWHSGKASFDDKDAIDRIKNQITDNFNKIQDILAEEYENYSIRILILRNLYSLALLNEIEKIINEMRNTDNVLHISEFNKRIAEIVFNEPIPFIYERIGERYKHFLLDEFQDTSILQWQNLLPLVENSLSEANFNMVVGDGKQAIYRFRGGEVEQFSKLPDIYKKSDSRIVDDRERSLKQSFDPKFLKNNFRSKAEIIDFNNQFFRSISSLLPESLKVIYEELEQNYNVDNKGGYVNINFVKRGKKEEYDKEVFENIRTIIQQLFDDGFSKKDITILCRNNFQANSVACYLTSQSIEVISSESLLLSTNSVVRFLIALLKIIVNPTDNVSKVLILNYLLNKNLIATNKSLKQLIPEIIPLKTTNNNKLFEAYLKNQEYDFNINKLNLLPLFELCETLVRTFKLNASPNPYVQFFLDSVLSFSSKKTANIIDFLDWWEEQKTKLSLKTPEGLNAVSIMTIHKSKGLEFPVVIFPFAEEKQRITKDMTWIEPNDKDIDTLKTALINNTKSLEETRFKEAYTQEKDKSMLDMVNLLYVAMTRPSERLYIITTFPPQKASEASSLPILFSTFLKEKGLWDEITASYNFGEPTTYIFKDKKQQNVTQLTEFLSTDWQKRIMVSHLAPENWDSIDPDRNRRFGTIIHDILSKTNSTSNIQSSLEILLKQGVITQSESKELVPLLNKMFEKAEIIQLFATSLHSKNEAEILIADGSVLRPDRLIFKDNEVIIVDYKTGKPEEKHKKQLDTYEDALKGMNYQNISKRLIYINDNPEVIAW